MKSIMVLGAGVYQLPLITKINELGYRSIVISPYGNYPGIDKSDIHIPLDTRDAEAILEIAKQYSVDAVMTTGTDVAVPAIGYIVDRMGLTGTGEQAANACTDKSLMKACLYKAGVKTAKYQLVGNVSELEASAKSIGYPLMVKAVDSSGSRGVTKVDNERDLYDAFMSAKAVTASKAIIVEQYLDGYELGAQAVVVGSDVVDVFIHSDEVTSPPICVPIGHAIPIDISDSLREKVENLVHEAVVALDIKNTISNVDIMIVDGEPYLLEIGARMGATCLPENISTFLGVNIYEYLIQLALGESPKLPRNYARQANAALLLTSMECGRVSSIEIPDDVSNNSDLLELKVDVVPGDSVRAFKVGPDRIGHVVVKGDTAEEAMALAKRIAASIKVTVE